MTMRQVCIPRYGRPDVLCVQDVPEPPLTPAGVRIAVHASGVNFADVLARQGLYPDCPKPPVVVGYEVAGRVLEVGADVTDIASGQRVVALTRFGGYAEQVVVPSHQVFALPANISLTEAAALPVNYLTAYLMLYVCGHLQSGEHVLIHGGAGGVGLAAVQLCRLREAHIYATASVHKHAFLQQQGVHHTFAYAPNTLRQAILATTDSRGVDIVLDPHGGRSFAQSYRLLAPLGRLVMFGVSRLSPGMRRHPLIALWHLLRMPRFHPLRLLNDNTAVIGVNLGHLWEQQALLTQAMNHLLSLYQQQHIQPTIARQFALSEASAAHQFMQNRQNIGKVLLISDTS
ncbi:alcohol dehydrogenase [Candidatus Entotheonella serta]|nr:alcohol dehydrogenase [Candidatus Entotheonella serta]